MAVITISRGSFSHGQEIAEKVAGTLGYECVSREILVDAAQLFNVSEKKLIRSLNDAPNILERIVHGKKRYLEYIKAALLGYVRKGNVVYHGHAGHLLLTEVPNVLKVRLLAEKDDRIVLLQQRQNISREQALAIIESEDKNRINWTHYLYKMDLNDPWLYDIVIKVGELNIQDACEIICHAAKSENYQTTEESKQITDDLAIANRIQVELQPICEAQVSVINGEVQVKVAAQKIRKTGFASPALQHHIKETIQQDLIREINEIANKVPGVKDVFCQVDLPYYT
jgi:cytidylate kinase